MRARTLLSLTLFMPFLMASKCRDEIKETPDGTGTGDLNTADVELQIVTIDPDRVNPNTSFGAELFGAGFKDGARVFVGQQEATRVNVTDENNLSFSSSGLAEGRYDVRVRNPDGTQASLRSALTVDGTGIVTDANAGCTMVRVYFPLDGAGLDADSQRMLSQQLACYQRGTVRIEGNCDDRGTTEYNLALGARRAAAVQKYLVAQGVPPSRIKVVSYGEERPLDSGNNEAAWSKNRRADVYVQE